MVSDLIDSRPKVAGQDDEIDISPNDSQLDNEGSLTIGPTFLSVLIHFCQPHWDFQSTRKNNRF